MRKLRQMATRMDRTIHERNVRITIRNIRRAFRLLNHPAQDADDAKILGALALLGYAVCHVGKVDMTIEEFRESLRAMQSAD